MKPEERLKKMGIELPPAPKGVGAYVTWIKTGSLILTSGQLPWREGKLAYTGKLGVDLDEAQGYQAARLCAINALAQFKAGLGELDEISQIVKVEGYVHCGPGFRGHPQVLNGASELFQEVFGDRGVHVRVALGITEMPLDAAVQIAVWAEFDEEIPF